jgi:hypothetical protein
MKLWSSSGVWKDAKEDEAKSGFSTGWSCRKVKKEKRDFR